MIVKHNSEAASTLNRLNLNYTKLSKDLQKLSSGKRVNGAVDGASEYSIGKKMEVMIRALDQDIDNTRTGRNLLQVAEGGIQNVIDNIRDMKEMALNSANDHNTDLDRATLQKDFEQRIKQIADIAATTNYNGRLLLNGDYAENFYSGNGNGETPGLGGNTTPPTFNPYVNEPNNYVATIPAGNYTITTDGIYELASGYSGTITVAAQNVEIKSDYTEFFHSTYIDCVNSNTNLWLNNVPIDNSLQSNTIDRPVVKFTGSGNTLNIAGRVDLYGQGKNTALVDVGNGLEIYEVAGGNSALHVGSIAYALHPELLPFAGNVYGACIGSDKGEMSDAYIIINGGDISVQSAGYDNWGASIGGGAYGSVGNIVINGGQVYVQGGRNASGIGTGYGGIITGNIEIHGGSIRAQNHTSGDDGWGSQIPFTPRTQVQATAATIGCGVHGVILGDINITGGKVSASNSWGAGAAIGTAGDEMGDSSVGNINIQDCMLSASSRSSEAVGRGVNPLDPICDLSTHDEIWLPVSQLVGEVGSVNIVGGIYSKPWEIESETHYHVVHVDDSSSSTTPINPYDERIHEGRPLIIHTGTKANQHLRVYINSMHPIALGINGMTINPRENAIKALEKIDSALEFALNENTKMGAYQARLNETEETLVTANENTIASNSSLTDADMAKSMSDFVKDNVLMQSAQMMLAQANQKANSVLELLQ